MVSLTYGFVGTDLDGVADALAPALGLQWEQRESSFRGGNYFLCRRGAEEFILQINWDTLDGEPFEDAPDVAVVLYASTGQPDKVAASITGTPIGARAVLLKRMEY